MVIRTRGETSIIPSVVGADISIIGAIGMALVSTEAFNAGVASIPEQFSDADWSGWMVWRSFSLRVEFNSDTGTRLFMHDFQVDSKAMRKAGPNETLVIIAESQAGSYAVSAPWRVLVKLS